jgi:hypothetical protein
LRLKRDADIERDKNPQDPSSHYSIFKCLLHCHGAACSMADPR